MYITEDILNSYSICPRQAWLENHINSEDKNKERLKEDTAVLSEAESCKIKQDLIEIESVMAWERPPKARWVGHCNRCAYCESCYV